MALIYVYQVQLSPFISAQHSSHRRFTNEPQVDQYTKYFANRVRLEEFSGPSISIILFFNQFSDSPFTPERLCMRAMTSPRMLKTRLCFWQARSIISWASTTKHSLLLLGRETCLKPKVVLMGQRSMLRLSAIAQIEPPT